MLMCAIYYRFAHETAGAARTRSSLLPLFSEERNDLQNFGRLAPRECGLTSSLRTQGPITPVLAGEEGFRPVSERNSAPLDPALAETTNDRPRVLKTRIARRH